MFSVQLAAQVFLGKLGGKLKRKTDFETLVAAAHVTTTARRHSGLASENASVQILEGLK